MSDILIKGMEMPISCGDCKAFVCYRQWAGDIGDCFCGITKNDAKAKEKNADCPLVPVPPHGRLIDADELKALVYANIALFDSTSGRMGAEQKLVRAWLASMVDDIDDAPTIIEAEEGE